jgi:hypothetical protein
MSTIPGRHGRRLGAAALVLAGALFLAYPVTRPWHDKGTAAGALASLGSTGWVASHLFAILGFILLPIGLLALRDVLRDTPAARLAGVALLASWVGVGLTLPYYGAEDFGLHAMARRAAAGESFDLVAMVDEFRYAPAAATTFGIGLVTLGIAAVLVAVAVWRSGTLSRYGGIAFAVAFALFLPQFYTPPASRIGHGVLVAAGCVWLAATLWRASPAPAVGPATGSATESATGSADGPTAGSARLDVTNAR